MGNHLRRSIAERECSAVTLAYLATILRLDQPPKSHNRVRSCTGHHEPGNSVVAPVDSKSYHARRRLISFGRWKASSD